jgi:hypothetical protein
VENLRGCGSAWTGAGIVSGQYLHLDAALVKAEIGKLIEAYPDLADDESLRADVVEGETDAFRIIERALSERRDAETMVGAIEGREAALAERRLRFERKSEAMKQLIKAVMRAADLPKVMLTEATISVLKARTTVEVHCVDDLPQGYFKTVRKPDTAAIKSALEGGEEIPGAFLATGEPGLMIRTK